MIESIFARVLVGVAAVLATAAPHLQAQNANVPKQVHLVQDGNRILASNVRLNRFDELKLGAQERVREQKVGEAVAVVVTNQRIVAYGVLSGWVEMDRVANETIQSISAEDYGALIVTDQRMLNFNGETGIWAEQKRRVSR
jgi:hypothetical protein